jgi:hypothetical protein
MMGIVGWFVVELLFNITTSLTVAAQMLGVEAAQFWAAHACPKACLLPAISINSTTTAANIKKTTLEMHALAKSLFMANPPSTEMAFPGFKDSAGQNGVLDVKIYRKTG